jgi:hypothetical protein
MGGSLMAQHNFLVPLRPLDGLDFDYQKKKEKNSRAHKKG